MPKVKDVIKRLQKMDPNDIVAVDIWTVEDVWDREHQLSDHEGDKEDDDWKSQISQKEAEQALEAMDHRLDANHGFSWEVLDYYM